MLRLLCLVSQVCSGIRTGRLDQVPPVEREHILLTLLVGSQNNRSNVRISARCHLGSSGKMR